MSRLKLLLFLFTIAFISSCSQFRAFEDRRREPGTEHMYSGSSKPGAPVICYTPFFYSHDEVLKIADDLCKDYDADTSAEFVNKDNFSCRLFIPSKAYYQCIKK